MDNLSSSLNVNVRLEFQHLSAHPAILTIRKTGAIMDCQTIETVSLTFYQRLDRALRVAIGTTLSRAHRNASDLDLEVMSDHMKRDLGFIDGRGPRPDHEVAR